MKSKFIFSCTLILLMTINLHAQTDAFPKGAYMKVEEIKGKSPSNPLELKVIKRTKGDIKMIGGNDYKLVSADKTVAGKTLRKELLAYSNGDTLYLNCLPYKLQQWYAAIISSGKYLIFKGGIPMDNKMYKNQIAISGVAFGAIGGAFAGAQMALMRFLYALDLETNTVEMIVPETLRKLLANRSGLLEQYNQEPKPEDESTLIKYLKMLNAAN